MITPAAVMPPPSPDVYRVMTRFGGKWYRKWTGIQWCAGADTPAGAASINAPCHSPNHLNEPWIPNTPPARLMA